MPWGSSVVPLEITCPSLAFRVSLFGFMSSRLRWFHGFRIRQSTFLSPDKTLDLEIIPLEVINPNSQRQILVLKYELFGLPSILQVFFFCFCFVLLFYNVNPKTLCYLKHISYTTLQVWLWTFEKIKPQRIASFKKKKNVIKLFTSIKVLFCLIIFPIIFPI